MEEITQKIYTQIFSDIEKESIKAIEKYCKENNIYSNIISEEKLKETLEKGIKFKTMIESLQQENKLLKIEKKQAIKSISHYIYERDVLRQQLKDKDEKISNAIKYIKNEVDYFKGEIEDDIDNVPFMYAMKCDIDDILKILEKNKED